MELKRENESLRNKLAEATMTQKKLEQDIVALQKVRAKYPLEISPVSKFVPLYANMSRCIQICSTVSKFVPLYPNLLLCNNQDLSRYIKICFAIPKFASLYKDKFGCNGSENLSRRIEICLALSLFVC